MTASPAIQAPETAFQPVHLPWGAWYGDSRHTLWLPREWQLDTLAPPERPGLGSDAITQALAEPFGSPGLEILARGRRRVCIVTDDLARPTRAEQVLRPVLRLLHESGVAPEAITILIATGSHSRLENDECAWKVGAEIARRYRVESHAADGSLASTGIVYGRRELRVNRRYLQADLRILVGSTLPHPFAGFSGGGKLVIPGLCDLDATERSHKFVLMGLRRGNGLERNRFRQEIEGHVRRLGLHFNVSVVSNEHREPAGVFAGDLVASHRRACALAGELYRTEIAHTYDCAILNAYPKDVDLIQSENALSALRRLARPAVREGGIVVLATAASQGLGRHGLFEPGGRAFRRPARNRALGERSLWLYAPSLTEPQARRLHWEGYPFFCDPGHLAAALQGALPGPTRAAILPSAPMQLLADQRPPEPPGADAATAPPAAAVE